MSEPTREAGDVISTLSLSHRFQYDALGHKDVRSVVAEIEQEDGDGFLLEMADGSIVSVIVSVYKGI